MSAINDALQQVGVDLAVDATSSLIGAISDFATQNLSPSDIAFASSGQSQNSGVGNLFIGSPLVGGSGEWESIHYADDLIAHQPKFKFLFKVEFKGFPGGSFSYFVHRCDKPKVRFNHTEVNFYSFRTKVLTSTTFDPLSFTFLDEIGNTVNSFFAQYVASRSNQGNGKASIQGGGEYSSTIPYDNGYSAGRTVEIQQIFGNGLSTNIFKLVNARIDSLEFDELNMELSTGSMMNCVVSYDAITCKTTGPNKINSWGNTDLYNGGGTSGGENGGSSSTDIGQPGSAIGGGIGGQSSFLTSQSQNEFGNALSGLSSLLTVPGSLADLVTPSGLTSFAFDQLGIVGSNGDIISSNIQNTINSISSGANLVFGGLPTTDYQASFNNPNYSNEGRGAPAADSVVSSEGGDFTG